MRAGAGTRTAPHRSAGRAHAPSLTLVVQTAVPDDDLPRRPTLRRWASAALERDATVTVRFVGTREGRALNARFRGRDSATNVLTFVYDEGAMLAGDLVLCVPVLRREARERPSFRAHCAHLVIHGMLHLQGYDHERTVDARRMEARETALLAHLGYPDPYLTHDPVD